MPDYPSQTRRNSTVASAKEGFEREALRFAKCAVARRVEHKSAGREARKAAWVAGRIIGITEDGFILQDESGRIEIKCDEEFLKNKVNVGDIAEVKIRGTAVESLPKGAEARAEKEAKEWVEKGAEKEAEAGAGEQAKAGAGEQAEAGAEEQAEAGAGEQAEAGAGEQAKAGAGVVMEDFLVLAECKEEFFISKESPNFLKSVIDLHLKSQVDRRSLVTDKIREFFKNKDFLETETPQLVGLPGMEPNLSVFKTMYKTRDGSARDMYLTTTPEYAMKKLLVAGYEKIFQICKSYRNSEEESDLHNPEFTLLEWYRAYCDYTEIMKDTEELVNYVAREITGKTTIEFKGNEIDLALPWERMKVAEAFTRFAGIKGEALADYDKLEEEARKKGYNVEGDIGYEELFYMIFLNEIEGRLGVTNPVILYDYPAQMAALAKLCHEEPAYAQRFEVYIAGVEICNAFTELNDPAEQKERLEKEREVRIKAGREIYDVDESFVKALRFGMPPAGGNALGVDRLAMLIFGVEEIKNILYFPHV